MTDLTLTEADIAQLTELTEILLPGTEEMPAASDIEEFPDRLQLAVRACGDAEADLRSALDAIPNPVDWVSARQFSYDSPANFSLLSKIIATAYYATRRVMERLDLPSQRQHPAAQDDFANEYLTGILDAVTDRGPIYRTVPEGQA